VKTRAFFGSLLGTVALFFGVQASLATTRTVTNGNDSGAGSLRDTIVASVNGDTIDFAPGLSTITLTSGELLIARNITIYGPGANVLTVQRSGAAGTPAFRIFHISNGTTSGPSVTFFGLTITNGFDNGAGGGGVYNDHSVVNVDSCVVNNNSTESFGGAIYSDGTVSGDAALSLYYCAITGNFAHDHGGGVALVGNNSAVIANCTISGNSANEDGGGIGSFGVNAGATLVNCTISGNDNNLGSFGGGVYVDVISLATRLLNTIVAGNGHFISSGPDVDGPVSSQGHNLIGKTDGSSGWVASDLTGTIAAPLDPLLGPLQNNGGPSATMALQNSSAAIDAGDDSVLGNPFGLAYDQRGTGFPRKQGAHVDIGAFEFDSGQPGPSFTVTNALDHDDGTCGTLDCTLREAINAANAASGANTIVFAANVAGTITLQSGPGNELAITDSVTITGPGARVLAISGNGNRVFSVSAGSSIISGLTIRDGVGQQVGFEIDKVGGGIDNQATLTVNDCMFINNSAVGNGSPNNGGSGGSGLGGAIFNDGILTLSRCTFGGGAGNGNSASGANGNANTTQTGSGGTGGAGQGGAVFNDTSGTLSIYNCTFNGNTAIGGAGGSGFRGGNGGNGSGGAIFNQSVMTLTAATINGNSGTGGGGGPGSTKFMNGAAGKGIGGIAAGGGSSSAVANNISAGNNGNNSGGGDVDGAFISSGYNLIGNGDFGSGFTAPGDQVGTTAAPINPQLVSLQNNGGATDTMELLAGSPAIDQGKRFGLTTDQRGQPRPYDDPSIPNANGGDGSDIGAFEVEFADRLRIISIVRNGNDIVIIFEAMQGAKYRLERKLNITDPSWSTVSGVNDLIAPSTGPAQFTDPGAISLGKAFYHVLLLP
jgi:CSLREA domain-containing protein